MTAFELAGLAASIAAVAVLLVVLVARWLWNAQNIYADRFATIESRLDRIDESLRSLSRENQQQERELKRLSGCNGSRFNEIKVLEQRFAEMCEPLPDEATAWKHIYQVAFMLQRAASQRTTELERLQRKGEL